MTDRAQKMQVFHRGKKVEFGEEVEFTQIAKEDWSSFRLGDGNRLRFRTSINRVYRACDKDGNQLTDNDGQPIYYVQYEEHIRGSDSL